MESTIFFGNGVNLLSKDGKSWDSILRQLSLRQILPPIENNTLKYEYIVLPQERYTDIDIGVEITVDGIPEPHEVIDTEEFIKENLAKKLSKCRVSDFYHKLAKLRADNYITTNYELFLCESLKKMGYHERGPQNPMHTEYPSYTFDRGLHHIRHWNIHGNVFFSEYIILGLYDYSKYVIKLDQIMRTIEKVHSDVDKQPWPYIMLNSNVHILGFGLGYEEIDIWHFLTLRKRLFRENRIQKNRIIYYQIMDNSYDMGKMELLKALDVDVELIEFDWSAEAYKNAYDEIYKRIKSQISTEC